MGVSYDELPFFNTVPIVSIGRVSAPLVGGEYNFVARQSSLLPKEKLVDNALYFISHFSFAMDISELDYQLAILDVPQINLYLSGEARTPLIRKPIFAPTYYESYSYLYAFLPQRSPNELLFSVRGKLTQTAALLGKQDITATMVLEFYEIVDDAFISQFKMQGKPGAIPVHEFIKGIKPEDRRVLLEHLRAGKR